MSQFVFTFNVPRCLGCMACVVACQDQNDWVAGENVAFRHVTKLETGKNVESILSYLSLACQHCEDAPCLMVCPRLAISRRPEDGAVLVDRNLCIGCHSCELVCPYGAPKFSGDGKMSKCDFCHIRRDCDMKPACVRVCPVQALDCGPIENVTDEKVRKASVQILNSLIRTPKEIS